MATRDHHGGRPPHPHHLPGHAEAASLTRPIGHGHVTTHGHAAARPAPAAAPKHAAAAPVRSPLATAPFVNPASVHAIKRPSSPAPAAAPVHTHWQLDGKPGQHLVLMPGQMHIGHQAASIKTLLGSCVAITLWHPARRIGGMCHFLLPNRNRQLSDPLDGRYGDEAVEAMVKVIKNLGTHPGDYVAHLYGGADTMSGTSGVKFNIGERNIEQGWTLIDKYGFQLDGVDVGEDIPRMVSLSMSDGVVNMRRGSGQAPDHLRG